MSSSKFDAISTVPWGELYHAYGPATDVPELLQALMSPEAASAELVAAAKLNNESLFEYVTSVLWSNVFHQGTVWQVTATTVPFFAAILRDGPDDIKLKTFLIDYLHHLALGYPQDLFPDLPNPEHEFSEFDGMEDPGGEPSYEPEENYRLLIWHRDSYQAVERHIAAVIPYLNADDEQLAESAIALCGSLPRCATLTVPLLRQLCAEVNRRGAIAAVSLAAVEGASAGRVAEAFAGSSDPLTSMLGSCAAIIADANNASDETVAILTRPLGDLAETASIHSSTVGTLVGRCLARLGSNFRERAADGICQQLEHSEWLATLSLTDNLLKLLFDKPPLPAAADLSTTERRALEAIRDFGIPSCSMFGNYDLLLSDWGIPSSAHELDAWLHSR